MSRDDYPPVVTWTLEEKRSGMVVNLYTTVDTERCEHLNLKSNYHSELTWCDDCGARVKFFFAEEE